MDIVVTVKQVPDPDIPPTHFKVDEAAKKVIPPAGVAPVMNGYDANALEAALRLKEQLGGKVTVVSLGGDSARDTLKRAIAMGADAAIHVNDPALNDADSTTTARALASAIKKLDHVDLVLCGRQASDTDGGQVHLGVASHLGLPAISPVQKIDDASAESLVAERIVEDADYEGVRVRFRGSLGTARVMMQLDTRGFYFQSPNTGRSGPAARRTRGVRTTVPIAPDSPMSARFR